MPKRKTTKQTDFLTDAQVDKQAEWYAIFRDKLKLAEDGKRLYRGFLLEACDQRNTTVLDLPRYRVTKRVVTSRVFDSSLAIQLLGERAQECFVDRESTQIEVVAKGLTGKAEKDAKAEASGSGS